MDLAAIRKNLKLLLLSGFSLGFNWVFLFAGYRHGIAISSLCNYMAPIIVVIITALIYKEKITMKQIFFICLAFVGMLLLISVIGNGVSVDPYCVIYGLLAALIGDAAGQVKPTSGGGLLIGFDACEMASRHVANAVENDDINLLRDYQKEFHKKYHKEFSYQFKVQRTLGLLSDEDLDYFFMKLRQNDCERIISEYGDMDKQSTLVKEFIKRGLIFKIMPTFLFKKIINIFGFR